MPYEILLQHVSIVPCLCVFGIFHFGLYYLYSSTIKNDREDGIIDEHLYPLARNEGGDYFYWDVRDENVYMIYCDDVENPVWVCDSIKAFFDLMENNQT